jgi:hypothetical protein
LRKEPEENRNPPEAPPAAICHPVAMQHARTADRPRVKRPGLPI